MTHAFAQFDLHPQLVQAVTELGYTAPTPIQAGIIPLMLAGHDVLGQAHTGTGKTAAFALPILHTMTPDQDAIQSLILAPTRELALQVAQTMHDYGRYRGVRVLAVYGGQPYARQINQLKKGVEVVVGTPGRVLDLLQQQALDLSGVRTVVLDEADEMLSMGFIEDIEAILKATPSTRQTALFSATLPPEIRRLADRYMRAPQSVTIEHKQRTVAAIEQRYYLVNDAEKLAALTRLFEVEPITSALVFVRTRVGTSELANELSVRSFPAEALHGDLRQETREQILKRFRQHQVKVLVATDVAARGLDIDDVSHVFNYDLPFDAEGYVHRIGRTGRAGKAGVAISLLLPKEQWWLRKTERYMRQEIRRATLPSVAAIEAYREAQLLGKMQVWLQRGRCRQEKAMVTQLMAAGHDPMEIAAAALKVARGEEKQRPIAPMSEIQAAPIHERQQRSAARGTGRQRANVSHKEGMVRLTPRRPRAALPGVDYQPRRRQAGGGM